ncbi:feruloyl-CoA synthase [Roseomonas frigidaquae]|uniref:Feruloyl-CoA synthase n=1 Tax=Falsiroseomonas frigidaquae TaxID=487318 RepID=A0ABX1F7V5_9PROT|nr:feruloyl-CoA synthase [Falsiroseomonas frigidaquae]NKE48470.1 feruloyl-CoA synthase [Falsiroseomonas frigidaquae]
MSAAQKPMGAAPVQIARRPDGTLLVTPVPVLGAYPRCLTERLEHFAGLAPDRTLIARRDAALDGDWRRISYAEAWRRVQALGQALLDRGLSAERPLVFLSGNCLDQAMLTLAALHVGVPVAPVSPAYSLLARDFAKLRHCLALLTPGLVFANDQARFAEATAAAVPAGTEVLSAEDMPALLATAPTPAVARAAAAVQPDDVAKILFTSGSTGQPKGVVNTHRMLCANQQMLREAFPFVAEEPPVLLDWLPWHHTFGGNHNIGLALYNGGSFYMDEGRPVSGGYAESLRNLGEIATSIHFNVPRGFEELVHHLTQDRALRRVFFSRLRMMFYSAAGLPQHIWNALDALALAECGRRIPMFTGLGATETAPFCLIVREEHSESGAVGLPAPGIELKLAPVAGKMEARVRGPSITPGYWRNPAATAAAFDEEGFYRFGDALVPLDPEDLHKGFRFDGRITEDFKMATGTWVSVGPLRAKLVAALAPYVKDAVIAGQDRDALAAILLPEREACAGIPDLPARLEAGLARLAAEATGSSNRVTRAVLLDAPLSLDAGEITDKGSINQRAVLAQRAALVESLYADPPGPDIICLAEISA